MLAPISAGAATAGMPWAISMGNLASVPTSARVHKCREPGNVGGILGRDQASQERRTGCLINRLARYYYALTALTSIFRPLVAALGW